MDILIVIFDLLFEAFFGGLFIVPPVALIIRAAINIDKIIKSAKKLKEYKYPTIHYVLNLIIDILLLIIVLYGYYTIIGIILRNTISHM